MFKFYYAFTMYIVLSHCLVLFIVLTSANMVVSFRSGTDKCTLQKHHNTMETRPEVTLQAKHCWPGKLPFSGTICQAGLQYEVFFLNMLTSQCAMKCMLSPFQNYIFVDHKNMISVLCFKLYYWGGIYFNN